MQGLTKCILTTYVLKWQFKDYPHIQITECKKIINIKNNRLLKLSYNNGSVGIWIGRKFILKTKINQIIEPIKKQKLPF
jgi:hypothetical protein